MATVHLTTAAAAELTWVSRSSYDTSLNSALGRHHPITFANETHGFVIGGSTNTLGAVNDLHIYDELYDIWTDKSSALAGQSFPARTYSYGVVLDEAYNPKAYMGFGSDISGNRLADWWEFDMTTLQFRQLATFPGEGRHHPSMVAVYSDEKAGAWEIHVGLGDGLVGNLMEFSNFNDYWSYSINTDQWTQLPNFPSSQRHHPYYFGLRGVSYTGFGHSSKIERDFYSFNGTAWTQELDFESYSMDDENTLITTEARVAGTQFSIDLPMRGRSTDGESELLSGAIGFVLSGDGDDHRTMIEGEFHAFYPNAAKKWRTLPSHPGVSRWAPGSFVMRGTARVYFTSGYEHTTGKLYSDVWTIDLSSLFRTTDSISPAMTDSTSSSPTTDPVSQTTDMMSDGDVEGSSGALMTKMPTSSPPSDSPLSDVSSDVPTVTPTDIATNAPSEDSSDDPSEIPSNHYSVAPTVAPTDSSPTYAPSKGKSDACITEYECDKRQAEMEFTDFRVGEFPTKGCFSKNGVAYWSNGIVEKITTSALPGEQKRIWCGPKAAEGADSLTAQEAIAFVNAFLDDVSSGVFMSTAKFFILGVLVVVVVMR